MQSMNASQLVTADGGLPVRYRQISAGKISQIHNLQSATAFGSNVSIASPGFNFLPAVLRARNQGHFEGSVRVRNIYDRHPVFSAYQRVFVSGRVNKAADVCQ